MSLDAFVEKCLKGEALTEDIDDFVDEWHEGGTGVALWEFLGFTHQEYKLWVERPNSLGFILRARKTGCPLDSVRTIEDAHRIAARSLSLEDVEELTAWLKKTGRISD